MAGEQERKRFDLENYLAEQLGARVTGITETGKARIATRSQETGEDVVQEFDVPSFLKDNGIDPTNVEVQYNSPATAVDENAVGFITGMKLKFAKTPEDAAETLKEEFGEDNVSIAHDGSVKVKDADGLWKNADSGFLATMTSSSPEIVAGIAGTAQGAKIGAAAGSIVMPGIGTAVGGVLGGIAGGALGSAVAKVGTDEIASKFGLRTEADAAAMKDELGKEFVNNLIWDSVLGVGGKVLKIGLKAGAGATKNVWDAFTDKETLAATAEKLIEGTNRVDWETVVRSADDAKSVAREMDGLIRYQKADVAGEATGALDPVTRKTVNLVKASMKSFKQRASRQYEKAMKTIEDSGALEKAQVQAQPLLDQMHKALDDLGLLGIKNGQVSFLRPNEVDQFAPVRALMDSKSQRVLARTYEQLKNAAGRRGVRGVRLRDPHTGQMITKPAQEGMLGWKDAKNLLNAFDDIIESSGYYKGGDAAISSQSRRILKGLRKQLRTSLGDSINDPKMRELYNNTTTKYSAFRDVYDDFAMQSKFGGGDDRVVSTVNRMLGEKGFALEENFGRLAQAVGADGDRVLNKLKVLRAAKNLSDVYAPSVTGMSAVTKGVLGKSPRKLVTPISNQARAIEKWNVLKQNPVRNATITGIKALGDGTAWLNSLSGTDRFGLLTQPQMLRQFTSSILAAPEYQEAASQQLMQNAVGQ